MERAFTVNLLSYAPLLKEERIRFKEDEKCLWVGADRVKPGWLLFISCKTLDTIQILKAVLAELKNKNIAFRLIKNQLLQYRLNAGSLGEDEVGKVIALFPGSVELAVELAEFLCRATVAYNGPVIPNAQRLGSVVYTQLATVHGIGNEIKLELPDRKKHPFQIPNQYLLKNKRKTVIGKYYVPVQLMRTSAKGDIFKAINMKNLAFNWCLVKEAKPVALDDHFNRTMKDRLLWQKDALDMIANDICAPGVLDFFEKDGSSYLVLTFAEGEPLGNMVTDMLHGKTWKELDQPSKRQLLVWYMKAVDIVGQVHQKGLVHRDLTDSNFIVLNNGDICLTDFELAYSFDLQKPNPPFLLGTLGYVAPEQVQHAIPDVKEDIYSLGALLAFLVTGIPPNEFMSENSNITKAKLDRLTGGTAFSREILHCTQTERKARPTLNKLMENINALFDQLN